MIFNRARVVLPSLVALACLTASATAEETTISGAFLTTQASNEWRSSVLIGTSVKNQTGETVGNINDVVVTADGSASAFIIGVGGVLGIGEKNVALPFKLVTFTTENDKRIAKIDATLEALKAAPTYQGEKTTFEKVQDEAADLAKLAKEKAVEMKDAVTTPKPGEPVKN